MNFLDVLLVEDEAGIRNALAAYLRLHGHRVREAATVDEALWAIDARLPDVLVSDERLEAGSGIDVARALKGRARDRRIAICTADVRPALAEFLREEPDVHCLRKPILPNVLRTWIEAERVGDGAASTSAPSATERLAELQEDWRARVEASLAVFPRARVESIALEKDWVRIVLEDKDLEASVRLPEACEAWPLAEDGLVCLRVHRAARPLLAQSARRAFWPDLEAELP